jgi:ACS family D-galactonate transporter-like MFS transporter
MVKFEKRWLVAFLLGSGILVNYIDRIALSVVAPFVRKEFGISDIELGILFSAFAWTYSLSQIPMGYLLDRFGAKFVGRVATLGWAVAALATSFSNGFGGLFAARLLLGIAEAPIFPIAAKAVSMWFPVNQRGLATAVFDSAAKLANVIGLPLLALCTTFFGWRGAFVCTALVSFFYFGLFWFFYRDPDNAIDSADFTAENKQEETNTGITEQILSASPKCQSISSAILSIVSDRNVQGTIIGFAAYGFAFSLYLSWMPQMLVNALKLNLSTTALLGAVPWLFATVSELVVGGWMIDKLIQRGGDPIQIRKYVLIVGLALGMSAYFVTLTTQGFWMVLWFTLSLSGLSITSPVFWSLPGLIVSRSKVGTLGGVLNFSNNLSGAFAPILAGAVFTWTGSFDTALIISSVLLLLGLVGAIVLIRPENARSST